MPGRHCWRFLCYLDACGWSAPALGTYQSWDPFLEGCIPPGVCTGSGTQGLHPHRDPPHQGLHWHWVPPSVCSPPGAAPDLAPRAALDPTQGVSDLVPGAVLALGHSPRMRQIQHPGLHWCWDPPDPPLHQDVPDLVPGAPVELGPIMYVAELGAPPIDNALDLAPGAASAPGPPHTPGAVLGLASRICNGSAHPSLPRDVAVLGSPLGAASAPASPRGHQHQHLGACGSLGIWGAPRRHWLQPPGCSGTP